MNRRIVSLVLVGLASSLGWCADSVSAAPVSGCAKGLSIRHHRGTISSITHGGGRYVAVGQAGTILTSLDGKSWQEVDSGSIAWLQGVAHGSGVFVAVGYNGTILTSPNGQNWTGRGSPNLPCLRSVIYGGGLFVAVGGKGSVFTSADGIQWKLVSTGTTARLNSVAHDGACYVAVGTGGTILRSADGRQWMPVSSLIGKPGPRAELGLENPNLLLKVLDRSLLMAVHPIGNASKKQREWVHRKRIASRRAP